MYYLYILQFAGTSARGGENVSYNMYTRRWSGSYIYIYIYEDYYTAAGMCIYIIYVEGMYAHELLQSLQSISVDMRVYVCIRVDVSVLVSC